MEARLIAKGAEALTTSILGACFATRRRKSAYNEPSGSGLRWHREALPVLAFRLRKRLLQPFWEPIAVALGGAAGPGVQAREGLTTSFARAGCCAIRRR